MLKKVCISAAVVLAVVHSSVQAKDTVDLITGSALITNTAQIGGDFLVTNTEVQPTGTGVIDPFLTIKQTNQERGFNTDNTANVLDDLRETTTWVRSVQLGEIGTTTINGTEYLMFLLDANQVSDGPLSLNQIQIFTSSVDLGLNGTYTVQEANSTNDAVISFTADNTEVFRMNNRQNTLGDLSTNIELWVDSSHGSGSGDMFLYVKSSLFGNDLTKYVTLFSQFGNPSGTYASNDGFEEWAFRQGDGPTAVTPEPSTLALALSGLAGVGLAGVRRLRRRVIASA